MSKAKKIVILGASITDSPWYTWKDFLEAESAISAECFATKGAGNEYMINSLVTNFAHLDEDTLVVAMFTNVDKFDWYVENDVYHYLKTEKHPPKTISKNSGFWCTGSHFPLQKQVYKEIFYSLDYFCVKTINAIMLLKSICNSTNSNLVICFDSPIWNYTEQDINSFVGKLDNLQTLSKELLNLPLSSQWANCLNYDEQQIYNTSLLGYCWNNGLDWFNTSVGPHPSSLSHWKYYTEILRPMLEDYVDLAEYDFTKKIDSMDQIWKNYHYENQH